jgi:hypothetical protein
VPLVDDIVDNPQDAKWNAVRAYLRTNDRSIDKVIIDDRNALVLAIYRNEPMGGEAAWGATIHPVDHGQRRTPDAPPKSRTVLVWSPVLRESELRIYRTGN